MTVFHKGNEFIIAKEGKEAIKLIADDVMDTNAAVRVLGQSVKGAGTFRAAAQTFLTLVYASPRMDTFRVGESNACSLEEGKPTKEFKAAVRSAEDDVVIRLAKEGVLKLKDEKAIQAFVSGLREDKNYSNAKVTCNKYVAYIAKNVDVDGYLVPIEAMKAELAEAMPNVEKDDSFAAKLRSIEEALNKGTITSEDAVESLVVLRSLMATIGGIVNGNAKQATENVEARAPQEQMKDVPASVPTLATATLDKALASAKATLKGATNPKDKQAHKAPAGFSAKLDAKHADVKA